MEKITGIETVSFEGSTVGECLNLETQYEQKNFGKDTVLLVSKTRTVAVQRTPKLMFTVTTNFTFTVDM